MSTSTMSTGDHYPYLSGRSSPPLDILQVSCSVVPLDTVRCKKECVSTWYMNWRKRDAVGGTSSLRYHLAIVPAAGTHGTEYRDRV